MKERRVSHRRLINEYTSWVEDDPVEMGGVAVFTIDNGDTWKRDNRAAMITDARRECDRDVNKYWGERD